MKACLLPRAESINVRAITIMIMEITTGSPISIVEVILIAEVVIIYVVLMVVRITAGIDITSEVEEEEAEEMREMEVEIPEGKEEEVGISLLMIWVQVILGVVGMVEIINPIMMMVREVRGTRPITLPLEVGARGMPAMEVGICMMMVTEG